jgi:hypothetical protein
MTQQSKAKRSKWIVETQAMVSEFLEVPRPTIAFWVTQGMPVEDGGGFDLAKITAWALATDRKIGWNVSPVQRRAFRRTNQ